MPESEPKPKLIELVAPGAGQGWKAVLKNGKPAVIHEINAPAAEAAAAVPRIQRLAEHRHPALAPVLAWGTEPNGIWVAVEPNEGVPLGTILSRGPLTPPAAAALGAAVLSGIAALHEAGIAMGGFGAAAVRVTGNGEVRLSGHPAAAVRGAPSQSDLRADVRSCGMAICAAFGVDPAGAPAPPTIPPGLVVTMRSMASGAMGPAADRAQGALREMASALLAPDRMTAAQSELALRAGGREMPSITPFLPKETFPPAAGPSQQQAPGVLPWGAPAPAPSAPQPPAPFIPRPAPDETPVRAPVSYEPPPRPTETYPPPPAPPVPPPYVPPVRREEPAPPPASYEPPPRARETFPPVTPPAEPPPPAIPTWDAKPAAPQTTWGGVPIAPPPDIPKPAAEPPAPVETWDTNPPSAPTHEVSSTPATPAANPPPTARPEPAPAEAKPTWTAIPTPVWTPTGDLAPAETETPPASPTPAPAPVAPAYTPPSYTAPSATPAASGAAAPASTPAAPPAPAAARKPPAPRRPVHDQPSERPTWLVPAIAAIVILLVIGVGGGIFLAGRGGSSHNTATASPSAKTSPKTSPKASPSTIAGPLPVPTDYAPAAAAPITKVAFCTTGQCVDTSANTSCQLGSSCRVTVEIKFSSVQRGDIAYIVKFFDRCTGTTTDLPGNHYTPPGFITVDITAVVPLPTGVKSAGIVAVTTSPASAASAPLLLGADSCT